MKLMIIDDHAGVRTLIYHLVAQASDAVCECATGSEAVRIAPYFKPHYVTVDVSMPGLDGFQTTRAICQANPEARVVVVSAYDQPEFQAAALQAGAVAFVSKENLARLRSVLLVGADAEQPPGPMAQQLTEQLKRSIGLG